MSVNNLVFQTGFDLYTDVTEVFEITENCQIQSPGRFGYGNCLNLGTNIYYDNPRCFAAFPGGPYTRIVAGFAMNVQSTDVTSSSDVYAFIDNTGAVVCGVFVDVLGRIGFSNNSSGTWETGPLAVAFNQWVYVEVDVIVGTGTEGSVQIRVNGQTVLLEPDIATTTAAGIFGSGPINTPSFPYILYDDMYVLAPETDVIGDSFLGDVKCVPLVPTSAGHETQWTQVGGTAGEPWTAVSEIPPDGDTSYVDSNTPGQIELFGTVEPSTITPVATVLAVSAYALARKDDSPARVVSVGISDGTTDYFDDGAAVGSDYSYITRQLPTNPITGEAWTNADFATVQFGVKLIS